MLCPKCGAICETDFVDIGVGMQQCSPYVCQTCRWVEPSGDDLLVLSEEQMLERDIPDA